MKNLIFDFEIGRVIIGEIEISPATEFRDLLARKRKYGSANEGIVFGERNPLTIGEEISISSFFFKVDAYFNAQEKIRLLSFMLLSGKLNSDKNFNYEVVVLDKKRVSKVVFHEVTSAKELTTPEKDVFSFKWGRVLVEANPLSMCCHINVLY